MRAVAIVDSGDNDQALIDIDLPKPSPGPRDLLVKVEAISVNPRDLKSRKLAQGTPERPVVLGWDAAGVVEAAGGEVAGFRPGDEVFYAGLITRQGANAEYNLVDARIVGKKPRSIDFAAAASLPLTSLTAYEMLFDRLGIVPGGGHGRVLLMLGGAGGVASLAVQLARRLTGLTVVASASREESAGWVRALGAHHVIDHSKPFEEQLKALSIRGADYVFSTHTTAWSWAEIARIVAPQGRVGLIDDPEPLDLRLFKMKSVSIHWEGMFTRPLYQTPDVARQGEILDVVAGMVDAGELRATATADFGRINAENLRRAHAAIEAGRTIGKIVLAGFPT